jgi:hypothetical protein
VTPAPATNDFPFTLDWGKVALILLFFAVMFSGKVGIVLVIVTLLIVAVSSVKGSMLALLFLSILVIGNGKFIDRYSSLLVLGRWLLLLVAAANIFLRTQVFTRLTFTFLLLMLLVLLNSVIFSLIPTISVFKISIFTFGVFAIFTAAEEVMELHGRELEQWVFNLVAVAVVLSVLLGVFLPGTAFLRSEFNNFNGIHGVLTHPQPFSVFLTVSIVYLAARLFDLKKLTKLSLATGLLLSMFVLVYFTRARISFAIMGGAGLLVLLSYVSNRRFQDQIGNVLSSKTLFLLLGGLGAVIFLNLNTVLGGAREFIFKNGRNGYSVAESFEGSRGFLILKQINNINENPFTGIGFGIPSSMRNLSVTRDPVFGLPIQAEVEKGIMYLAVVEENGVFLGVAILFFMIYLMIRAWSPTAVAGFALVSACLLVNIGEAIFFSLGGIGLYVWLLLAIGLAGGRSERWGGGVSPSA